MAEPRTQALPAGWEEYRDAVTLKNYYKSADGKCATWDRPSTAYTQADAAGPAVVAETASTTSPVMQRILCCQSGRWHDSNTRCPSFEVAFQEIKAGYKSSCWMWCVPCA